MFARPRVLLCIVASLGCGACAPAAPPPATAPSKPAAKPAASPEVKSPHSPEVERLLAAVREKGETELDLSWAEDNLGGAEGAKKFATLFNRMYGINVKVNFTPGPGFQDALIKMVQEVSAGQRPFTDVNLGSEGHFVPILNREIMEEYDYTQMSPRISKELVTPKNIGVEIASRVPGIVHNTNLVPKAEAPKSLDDVLLPKWKGKIASTPTAASFDSVAYVPGWNADRIKTYVARLGEHVAGLIRGNELERISSGEFQLVVLNTGDNEVRKRKPQGQPLEHVIPEDAPMLTFWYLGIPRTSPHPNLAKLYINMLVSEEGQRILYENTFTDHHALPGSQWAGELSALQAKGIPLLRIDAKFGSEHPEKNELSRELGKIMLEKSGR